MVEGYCAKYSSDQDIGLYLRLTYQKISLQWDHTFSCGVAPFTDSDGRPAEGGARGASKVARGGHETVVEVGVGRCMWTKSYSDEDCHLKPHEDVKDFLAAV